ncbi:MAG: biopolymer transporter ExbD [Saprospiraceae bacterium]|nr:biopolymer transporter ExbD [Saprospiraceae bacterium]
MGLKKRTKVSSEFNMSSLTDIIFLLLIFFMLTSTVVAPNALNLKLPGSSRSKVVTPSNIDDVKIDQSGRFFLNGKRIDIGALEGELRRKAGRKGGKLDITISPESGTPTEHVVAVMDVAMRNNINGILATDFKE